MSSIPEYHHSISHQSPPQHFPIFTKKYTLLVSVFFGMAIAGPNVLIAEDIFGLEKRACGVGNRYTTYAV
jgi:hypothetical protein